MEEGITVCPGEELTYNCTIFDDAGFSATFWRMTPQPCDGGAVALFHGTVGGPPIECGNFSAQLIASDGDCYTSTLTVTSSPELNGSVVRCEDSTMNAAGNASIIIIGRYEVIMCDTNPVLHVGLVLQILPPPSPSPPKTPPLTLSPALP